MDARKSHKKPDGSFQCWPAEVNFRNGFPKASDPRDQNDMCGAFHDVAFKVTPGLFLSMLLVTQASSHSLWKRLHKGMNSRKRGLSWRLPSTWLQFPYYWES